MANIFGVHRANNTITLGTTGTITSIGFKHTAGSQASPIDVTNTRQHGIELHYSGNNYNVTGIRSRAQLVTTDTSAFAQGGLLQAANNDGINAGVLNGALIEAIGKSSANAATISTMRGVLVGTEWGAFDTVTNLKAAHIRVHSLNSAGAGSFGTGYGLYIENEAVGGNGQALDAGIYLKGTNLSAGNKAYNLGMDFTGATYGTADIKLSDNSVINDSNNRWGVGVASPSTAKLEIASTSDYGIFSLSTDRAGIKAESTDSFAGYFVCSPASTNTEIEILRIRRETTGTGANGIGGYIQFSAYDDVNNAEVTARISSALVNVTSGSETSNLSFWTRTGGNELAERVNITGAGILQAKAGAQIGDGGVTNYTNFATDGTQTFNGTARIDWTKITANGVTLGDGPPTSADSVSDLQTAHDGNTYAVSEIAGNAGQNLIVDFTGVTAFNWVQILGRVADQAGHCLTVQLEITPFNDSAWHTYHVMKDQNADQNFENYSFFVPDDSAYINSGAVKIRFIHEMNGNANDDWVYDVVALYR
jgi:hypothetical protein